MTIPENPVTTQLHHLHAQIKEATAQAPLAQKAPQLIAVSKRQPTEAIRQALEAGQRHFGENLVQEAQEHWQALKETYPDISLHLIGPLQSNKVKQAVALFDVIHTVDREKIADALAAEMAHQGRELPCLMQVNIGEEAQKSGVAPAQACALWDYSVKAGLKMCGLMGIPPADEEPAPYFALLHQMAARLGAKELSMGMSSDYEAAIRFGATYIRVGTALFGLRDV
jgi:pyridoxal phosphate enzyme (YggS family)